MSNAFNSSRETREGNTMSQPDAPIASGLSSREIVAREKEMFGGIKIGSAFFGWLTATGTAVLIGTILAASGAALAALNNTAPGQAADAASRNAGTAGIVAGIVLLTVLFLSYYCGGYVAGRMARFNGARQGIAVWAWGIVMAIAISIIGAIAGAQTNVLASLQLPALPIGGADVTTGSILLFIGVLAVTLLGAVIGGMAGMHFHRKVDRAVPHLTR